MECVSTNDDPYSKYINEEALVQLWGLSNEDRDDIIEDMQDWETYMYCREAQERVGTFVDDLPSVRLSGELFAENIIYFKVIDEQSKTKDIALGKRENSYSNEDMHSLVPDSTNIEIRPRETWGHYVSAPGKEEQMERARIFKAKGNDAYNEKDYKKAFEFYSKCIAYGIDQISVPACNNRAQTNMKLGNYIAAISDLNVVLKAEPKNEKALFRRAHCRKELKMYREALKDLDSLSRYHLNDAVGKALRADIEKIIPTLNGKSYRLRENLIYPETFQVDESQLLSYAETDQEYLLEVDKNGCFKKCVCNHCTFEDRANFQSNNRLRIERPKWKPLTLKLLDDLGISQKSAANSGSDNDSVSKENGGAASKAAPVKNVCSRTSSTTSAKSSNITLLNKTNGATPITQNEEIPLANTYQAPSWPITEDWELTEVTGRKVSRNRDGDKKLRMRDMNSSVTGERLQDFTRRKIFTRPHQENGRNLENVGFSFSNSYVAGAPEEMLFNLKGLHPHSFERVFDGQYDGTKLTRFLNSICKDFNIREEWELISEYLKVFARSKSFATDIKIIDKRTFGDVLNTLDFAVNLGLKDADELQKLYSS